MELSDAVNYHFLEMQETHVDLKHKKYLKPKGLSILDMLTLEKKTATKMHESTLVQRRDVEPTSTRLNADTKLIAQ